MKVLLLRCGTDVLYAFFAGFDLWSRRNIVVKLFTVLMELLNEFEEFLKKKRHVQM